MPKRPRRDEILAWLKDHPDVTRYVIIDEAGPGRMAETAADHRARRLRRLRALWGFDRSRTRFSKTQKVILTLIQLEKSRVNSGTLGGTRPR
jgi:hypothetical protein